MHGTPGEENHCRQSRNSRYATYTILEQKGHHIRLCWDMCEHYSSTHKGA